MLVLCLEAGKYYNPQAERDPGRCGAFVLPASSRAIGGHAANGRAWCSDDGGLGVALSVCLCFRLSNHPSSSLSTRSYIHPPTHPSIHDPSMSDSHPSTRASSCGRAYVGPQRTRVANPRGPCLLCLRYLACVTCSLPPLSVAPVAAVTPPLPRRRARNAAAEPPPRSIRLEIDIRCNARSPAL